MLYIIIIAAVVAVLLLKKKSDNGSGGTGGGSGTKGGDVLLPRLTRLYKDTDGQLVFFTELGADITVTPLLDPTRPDYRYFERTEKLPIRK